MERLQTANSRRGKVMRAQVHDPSQEFKQLFKYQMFLFKVKVLNSIFIFSSVRASLAENVQIDEQLANSREGAYAFRVHGKKVIVWHVTTCRIKNTKLCPVVRFRK